MKSLAKQRKISVTYKITKLGSATMKGGPHAEKNSRLPEKFLVDQKGSTGNVKGSNVTNNNILILPGHFRLETFFEFRITE